MILGFGEPVTLNVHVVPRMVIELVVAPVTTPRTISAPAGRSTIRATTSRPFAKPASGKIAVKVINHYGDEVLKVYDVAAVSENA